MPKKTYDKMMNHLCKYEYKIIFNGELVSTILGHTALFKYCKEKYKISRTIVEQLVNHTWKPKFEKHKWLQGLQVERVERCID